MKYVFLILSLLFVFSCSEEKKEVASKTCYKDVALLTNYHTVLAINNLKKNLGLQCPERTAGCNLMMLGDGMDTEQYIGVMLCNATNLALNTIQSAETGNMEFSAEEDLELAVTIQEVTEYFTTPGDYDKNVFTEKVVNAMRHTK